MTQEENEAYLKKLLGEIETAKQKNKKGVFKINTKLDDNIAKYCKSKLFEMGEFRTVEFHKCTQTSKTWDIVIMF